MAARQGFKFKSKLKNNKARYKVKYTYSQQIKSISNGKKLNKYKYSKKIYNSNKNKYSYKYSYRRG